MDSSHPTGLIQVREASLRQFAPPFLQPLVALAAHAPPILVRPLLLFRLPLALPVPPTSLRLRNVTPDFLIVHFLQYGAAVVALIGHHLFHSYLVDFTRRRLRFRQRLVDRRR